MAKMPACRSFSTSAKIPAWLKYQQIWLKFRHLTAFTACLRRSFLGDLFKENAIIMSSNLVLVKNEIFSIHIYSNQLEKQLFIVPNLIICD